MKTKVLLLFSAMFLIFGGLAFAQENFDHEPPLLFNLTADGTTLPITIEKKEKMMIQGKEVELQLRLQDFREFNFSGVSFHYPRSMVFEFEKARGLDLWTLNGANVLIMLQRYPKYDEEKLLKTFTQELKDEYAEQSLKVSPISRTFHDHELQGMRFDVKMLKQTLRQDVYIFSSGDHVFLLMLQRHNFENNEEYNQVLEMLDTSLAF